MSNQNHNCCGRTAEGCSAPDEAYEYICEYLGKRCPMGFLYEFDKVYGVRRHPGDWLCVVKETGEVMWGEELPDDLYPEGIGIMRFIRKAVWKKGGDRNG